MFNKKIVLIFVILIGFYHINCSAINPKGHDYRNYSRNMENEEMNDLPFSWLLMKLFTNIFGNPRGLYFLSVFACMTLYIIYLLKIKNLDMMILFSLCFFWLYPVFYLSGGVLRNLLGLCWLSYSILHCKERDSFYDSFMLSVTHIPSLIIYMFYKLSRKNFRSVIYSILCYGVVVGLGSVLEGMIWTSSLIPLRMVYMKIVKPFYFLPFIFRGTQVLTYAIIVFVFCFYAYYKFMKTFDRDMIFWLIMLIIPFIPIYSYKVQLRFLLFSILPMFMFIVYEHEKESVPQKMFLLVIGVVSMVVRIMGMF